MLGMLTAANKGHQVHTATLPGGGRAAAGLGASDLSWPGGARLPGRLPGYIISG